MSARNRKFRLTFRRDSSGRTESERSRSGRLFKRSWAASVIHNGSVSSYVLIAVICFSWFIGAGCGSATLYYQGLPRHRIEVEGQAKKVLLKTITSQPTSDSPNVDTALDSGRYLWMEGKRYDLDYHGNVIVLDDAYGLRTWTMQELPAVITSLEVATIRHLRQDVSDDMVAEFKKRLSRMSGKELIEVLAGYSPAVNSKMYFACEGYDLVEAELSRRAGRVRSILLAHQDDSSPIVSGILPRITVGKVCERLLRKLPAK